MAKKYVDIKDENLLKAINVQLGKGRMLDKVTKRVERLK